MATAKTPPSRTEPKDKTETRADRKDTPAQVRQEKGKSGKKDK